MFDPLSSFGSIVTRLGIFIAVTLPTQTVVLAQADWRTHPALLGHQTPPDTWLRARTQVKLDAPPATFPLTIAADTKYWLYVNGVMAVREGGLKQGPTPTGVYADTVDIARFLKAGDNVIALELWHLGKEGFSHRNLGRAAWSVTGPPELREWWVARDPSHFRDTTGPAPNYRLPESNIAIDGRLNGTDWQQVDYVLSQDVAFKRSVPLDTALGALVLRPIPQWKDFGRKPFPDPLPKDFISTGDTLSLKLPYNAQITPFFAIDAPRAGMRVDVRTDNYRGGGPPNVRTVYLTREGTQFFETPGWMNGHAVRFHFPKGITIRDLGFRESGYATERAGGFTSGDPRLDTLWEKAARTLYITMRDSYMDCPDRERAQWWGDVVIELGEAFYTFDSASTLLARKGFQELFAWQRTDSTIFSPVPAGNWDQELPTQMLASVGYYGLWNYYYFSGDKALVEEVYPALDRYIKLWQVDEEGLVIPRKGGWTWGDWGERKDLYLLFQGWYGLALKGYAESAELTSHTADAAWARARMAKLRDAVRAKYYTPQGYVTPKHEFAPDDRVQALAVLNDWATPDQYEALRQNLQSVFQASPYMERYVLEALMQMGYPDDAITRMKQRYAKMIDSDLTTLWEGWGLGAEGFGGGTYNHAWSGGPLTVMSQRIAGLTPAAPGWGKYRLAPQLGSLQNVEAYAPTPSGELRVKWRWVDNATVGEVSAPPGLEGELLVAARKGTKRVPKVWVHGRRVSGEPGAGGFRYPLVAGTRGVRIK